MPGERARAVGRQANSLTPCLQVYPCVRCLDGHACPLLRHRNVLGWKGASSEEFAKTEPAVVVFMPEIDPNTMGGNMRLGLRKTIIKDQLVTPGGASKKTLASILHEDAKGRCRPVGRPAGHATRWA